METVVTKSPRRKKTAAARIKKGKLYIYLPAGIGDNQANRIIDRFRKKLFAERKNRLNPEKLQEEADRLNRKYFQGQLNYTITWSARQHSLFGSCSFKKGTIRISTKLAKVPRWALRATIMHELTHLLVHSHGKKFWRIANRYPLMERARGYLTAMGEKT